MSHTHSREWHLVWSAHPTLPLAMPLPWSQNTQSLAPELKHINKAMKSGKWDNPLKSYPTERKFHWIHKKLSSHSCMHSCRHTITGYCQKLFKHLFLKWEIYFLTFFFFKPFCWKWSFSRFCTHGPSCIRLWSHSFTFLPSCAFSFWIAFSHCLPTLQTVARKPIQKKETRKQKLPFPPLKGHPQSHVLLLSSKDSKINTYWVLFTSAFAIALIKGTILP